MNILKPVNRTLMLLTMVMTVAVLGSLVFGQGSLLITYQGRLTDSVGEPITGTPPMTFTIYDRIGVSKWSESHLSVLVDNGLFSAILGSQTALPDSVFNGEDRYLGISVDGDVELSPRTLLTSSPGAAYARRLIGDVITGPGMVLVTNSTGDSAVVLAADPGVHAMRLHPPDPCVPPEPCIPALELIATTELHSMKLFPPDPPVPPEPCIPAFEVTSGPSINSMKINWAPLPDFSQSAFEVGSDATTEQVTMTLMPPPGYIKPGIELTADAATSTASIRMGCPPDDQKPSVEIASSLSAATLTLQGEDPTGATPLIAMSADATGAKLGIGTNSFVEALTVMGNGWFSGDVYTYTDTRAKSNIVPIGGALDKVSRMNGYYYDFRTDEFPGLRLPETRQVGFLAHEVKEIVPEAVSENEQGLTGVSYSRITALLVEAVKELKAENEELRSRLDALENR